MFPEGTRHGGESLLPFKKGAFHVAISCQCPLQPIVVSQYYFLNSKKHIFDEGKLNIKYYLLWHQLGVVHFWSRLKRVES